MRVRSPYANSDWGEACSLSLSGELDKRALSSITIPESRRPECTVLVTSPPTL